MKIGVLALTVCLLSNMPAYAQSLAEISNFAQSICGDIPEGSITRTEIEGKFKISVAEFIKLIGGSGEATAAQKSEIYKGIPFDKLPNNIPTVSMCKSELVKILLERRVSINTCRHPDFGQEGW